MANDQTGSPDQRAHAPAAQDGADATLEAARAALQTPGPVEQPVMVLLVDDQAIVAEAVRQALAAEDGIDFHYCGRADEAMKQSVAGMMGGLNLPGLS